MDVAAVIAVALAGWTYVPGPADPAAVAQLAAAVPVSLPGGVNSPYSDCTTAERVS